MKKELYITDNFIVIDLSLFSLNQRIFIYTEGKTYLRNCSIDEISENIFNLCDKYSIKDVKISGQKDYSEEILKKIITQNNSLYSKNKINIEVI